MNGLSLIKADNLFRAYLTEKYKMGLVEPLSIYSSGREVFPRRTQWAPSTDFETAVGTLDKVIYPWAHDLMKATEHIIIMYVYRGPNSAAGFGTVYGESFLHVVGSLPPEERVIVNCLMTTRRDGTNGVVFKKGGGLN